MAGTLAGLSLSNPNVIAGAVVVGIVVVAGVIYWLYKEGKL